MTDKEAIAMLKRNCSGCMHPQQMGWCKSHCEFGIAIEAIRKTIPLPPKEYVLYTEDYEEVKYQGCPACKAILGRSHYFLKICSCGQQLEV